MLKADTLTSDLRPPTSDLVSFVLHRAVCGENSRPYNKWFVEAITVIRHNPRADLQKYWIEHRWPDERTIRDRLPGFALYRRESIKTRVILEGLEESFGHREQVGFANLTIEHIMPQTITNNKNGKAWKDMLGADWEKSYEALLDTLGNLTLTAYNTELSNSPFETKKTELAKSHLELNAYFTGLQKWDAEAILKRGALLMERVLGIWPRPASETAYAASAEAMPEPEGLTNAAKARLEYWRQLDPRLEERGLPKVLKEPVSESTLPINFGTTGEADFEMSINQARSQIHFSLYLSGKVGGFIAQGLAGEKEIVDQEMGYKLKWDLTSTGGYVFVTDEGVPIRDKNDWPVQHDWLADRLEDFQRVLQPRVLTLEKAALDVPELRQAHEQRALLEKYWRACSDALIGSKLSFRYNDLPKGQTVCRFNQLEEGIKFGVQYYPAIKSFYLYLGVPNSAGRNQRRLFKELLETHIPEIEAALGEKLHPDDPYLSAVLPADMRMMDDWPRQHQWIRETAEKFLAVFKPRLEIE